MEEKVKEYINKIALAKGIKVGNETNLFDEYILDSMGIIGLLSYLQDEFNIEFVPEDLQYENYKTISSIIKWLDGIG